MVKFMSRSFAADRGPLPGTLGVVCDQPCAGSLPEMPARWISVVPATALREGLDAIRREAGVPERFPDDVLAEAEAAAARAPECERVDIPFVTIDPPGARDLDQAMHIERRGDGHRVHYAIADPGAFITPGGALDRETHARARDGLHARRQDPAPPAGAVRGRRRACCPASGGRRCCGRSTSTRAAS